MDNKKIARINELARKSKTPAGLTAAEKEEQAKLRQEYIAAIRADLKSTLDNIDIKEKDGSITHVRDIPKRNAARKTGR
jgi:5-formyltetrahydrofolate cyclo-ligase